MTESAENNLMRHWIPRILLAGLMLLSFMVLREFLLTLVWALIITYIMWPPYRWLRQKLNEQATLSAALMTLLLAVVLLATVYGLAGMLQTELISAYQTLISSYAHESYQLPAGIKRIPWFGQHLQNVLQRLVHDQAGMLTQLNEKIQHWLGQIVQILGNIGETFLKLGVILVTVFFCFRDGQQAVTQLHQGLIRFLGKYQNVYLQAIGSTTRAVVYGLVLAALAQGLLAGIGYAVAGVKAPVLFGVVTALLAMVPMGATLVWFPLGILLLLTDQHWQGVGLLAWGFLVVSTVDNVIRPLVISGASRLPLLVVMFGVLGGLSAFGVVGLFLGPVVLAVLLAVWQAWLQQDVAMLESPLEAIPPAWHTLSVEHALQQQGSDLLSGLSQDEAEARLQANGSNCLIAKPPRSVWSLLLAQFKSFLVLVLLVASVLAALIGDLHDGLVILVVVCINAVLGFYQEFRAEQSLDALKNMLALQAKVRRAGETRQVPAEQLVPGDIVLLEAGDKIPADGRITLAFALEVDESSLTGESVPVSKQDRALESLDLPLAERGNMLYMNTALTRGRAEMLVTATGMQTEMGKLAHLLAEADEAETPLQKQLDSLGKRLALIAVLVISILFVTALWRGEPLLQTLMTAIALAIAAIPEGLPAVVTVTLALGMHRMARQRAIVKRLSAVETLGCTTVICTDKTGTLTVNQMTVRAVYYREQAFKVTGEGYNPVGAILSVDSQQMPDNLDALLLPLVLCNDSHVQGDRVLGDPMECALLVLAAKAGLDKAKIRAASPRIAEIPFDALHKFMATFHRDGDNIIIYLKGAPEILLQKSQMQLIAQQTCKAIQSANLLQQNARLAQQGLRVLGLAMRTISVAEFDADTDLFQYINNLTFIALIGLMDPPRTEVRDAIAVCKQAGIAVKMITGDQPQTAAAIANELGLQGGILEGQALAQMDTAQLAACIDKVAVFARTAPEQKVRIVQALKAQQHVVAMTGDGVNDAPALRSADIGIAMGITGTDVAKEAAAMILTDDNFATITRAVREGRGIYANMIKFVRFQLATNIGAILTVAAAPLLELPVPFTAVQLLWINIIMDGPPAMSLGIDPCNARRMSEPPRNPSERILSLKRFTNLFTYGLIMAAGTLAVLFYALQHGNVQHATTLAFTTFVLFQVFNVFNARNENDSSFNRYLFHNQFLWLALAGVVVLQIMVVHLPVLQEIFETAALTVNDWLTAVAVASMVLLLEEIRKLLSRARGV